MKYLLSLTVIGLFLTGCSNEIEHKGEYSWIDDIDIFEEKVPNFFNVNGDFELSSLDQAALERLLKNAKGKGIENIRFMIVSNTPVPIEKQNAMSEYLKTKMAKAGFLNSRIIDSGVCIYKDAKKGVRVDILKYRIDRTNVDLWNEGVGDCDVEKNMPRYGATNNYNLEEMVANRADLISPRKYPGQRTDAAINAMSSLTTSSAK